MLYLVGALFCQQLPHVDTYEATSGDVIQGMQAPTSANKTYTINDTYSPRFFFFFFSILCKAAFNAAYSHTGGQARELVRS